MAEEYQQLYISFPDFLDVIGTKKKDDLDTIKLLPMDQPWASLITLSAEWNIGIKVNETRPKTTVGKDYRGWVAIHANQKYAPLDIQFLLNQIALVNPNLFYKLKDYFNESISTGGIIGLAKVIDVVQMNQELIDKQKPLELITGDWQIGRWAIKLENVIVLPELIPYKASQGCPKIKDPVVLEQLQNLIKEKL